MLVWRIYVWLSVASTSTVKTIKRERCAGEHNDYFSNDWGAANTTYMPDGVMLDLRAFG